VGEGKFGMNRHSPITTRPTVEAPPPAGQSHLDCCDLPEIEFEIGIEFEIEKLGDLDFDGDFDFDETIYLP
jgi:hypothetical protein